MIDDTDIENRRIDALTHRSPPPIEAAVRGPDDLAALRGRWLGMDSIPFVFSGREEGADHSWAGRDIRTLLHGDESSGRWSLHDIVLAPGSGFPTHYQDVGDTYWWVIEGEVDLRIGDAAERVGPLGFGYAPARTRQAVANRSSAPARLLAGYAPAGADRAFAAAHRHWVETDDRNEASYEALLSAHGFRFDGEDLENDRRTNAPPSRLEAEINSVADFEGLRAAWMRRPAIPKLLRGPAAQDDITLRDGGVTSKILLSGDEGAGHAVVFIGSVQPTVGAPPHHQPSEEEIFYVIEGSLELTCGSATKVLGPGGFGFAPRNATHGFKNVGGSTARAITINSPAGHERGFEMVMREMGSERFDELMVAHGWRMHEAYGPA